MRRWLGLGEFPEVKSETNRTVPVFLAVAIVILGAAASHAASLQTTHVGRLALICRQGSRIVVDFDHATVTDSVSDTPAPAQITDNTISWHSEFDSYQFDPHYGGQVVHHSADHTLDRPTGNLTGGDNCGTAQN
jgi:hypothetical protein